MICSDKGRARRGRESGFTLIELLITMMLISILVTLGALALRQYWFVRSLEGGKDGMITTLRGIQQRVQSASNPLVFGARFTPGDSEWELIEYNRATGTCTPIRIGDLDPDQEFDAGVRVTSAEFTDYLDGTPAVNITDLCRGTGTPAPDIAWFFARGSASAGRVTVLQPILNRSKSVCVTGLTGRVEEC